MAVDAFAVAVYGFLPRVKRVEEAGIVFEAQLIRERCENEKRCVKSFYAEEKNGGEGARQKTPEDEEAIRSDLFDADNEKYMKYLLKLDSADTNEQDHYKVLGLSKLRFEATAAEIRAAYRQKVLLHHPDKKKAKGIDIVNEEYFVCITKAFEQLGTTEQKRRAFDSVDKEFDDATPSANAVTADNFFQILSPVFARNARWSVEQPVPLLGDPESGREEVENFYNFWFNWNSWREYSYLDEEDKEKGEDRWERREMEKINKVERERRRKQEVKRIRNLVDLAYAKDPRIARFKKEQTEAKERAKEEKQRAQREKKEREEREKREKEEAALEEQRKQEEEARKQREDEKRKKQEAKRAGAIQKKRLKKLADDAGHWTSNGNTLEEMERIERLCLLLTTEELAMLCDLIEQSNCNDSIRQHLDGAEANKTATKADAKKEDANGKENREKEVPWTSEENALLIKATNLFPAGTSDRWMAIADYVNEHRKEKAGKNRTEKEAIKQVKLVQTVGVKAMQSTESIPAPSDDWSSAEQKKLEMALREFPSSDPDRWDKITAKVGTRTKKECVRRFKMIAEMVKKSKENNSGQQASS